MSNMFAPAALDQLVKDRAAQLRRETDTYVPEWEALADMLAEDHQQAFRERYDGDLTVLDEPADADTDAEDPTPSGDAA